MKISRYPFTQEATISKQVYIYIEHSTRNLVMINSYHISAINQQNNGDALYDEIKERIAKRKGSTVIVSLILDFC